MTSRTFSRPAFAAPALPAAGRLAPGLFASAFVALAASGAARLPWLQAHGVGALTLAIALGLLAGNLAGERASAEVEAGAAFARQRLLRMGIVLYGLRLTFADVAQVGVAGVAIDAVVLASTFALAVVLGVRVLGLDRTTAMLIGAGSSICGAAAVMATAPVVRARPAQAAVAVATVVAFGTAAMFAYPALWHAGLVPLASPRAYGLWAGSTIHEVAQVVAAGHAAGEAAGEAAVVAKMVRVMMLAPFLVGLSARLARARPAGDRATVAIPWFAFGFVAMTGVHSLHVLPAAIADAATAAGNAALATAMAALGLGTRVAVIRAAGLRPLALGAALSAWLVAGGAAINAGLAQWLG